MIRRIELSRVDSDGWTDGQLPRKKSEENEEKENWKGRVDEGCQRIERFQASQSKKVELLSLRSTRLASLIEGESGKEEREKGLSFLRRVKNGGGAGRQAGRSVLARCLSRCLSRQLATTPSGLERVIDE